MAFDIQSPVPGRQGLTVRGVRPVFLLPIAIICRATRVGRVRLVREDVELYIAPSLPGSDGLPLRHHQSLQA